MADPVDFFTNPHDYGFALLILTRLPIFPLKFPKEPSSPVAIIAFISVYNCM